MFRSRRGVVILSLAGICVAAAWRVRSDREESRRLPLRVIAPRDPVPADGSSVVPVEAYGPDGGRVEVTSLVLRGDRVLRVDNGRLRTTALPGKAEVQLRAAGFRPARIAVETRESTADRFGDGTPDYLRLDSVADREAFRVRFAAIAESQAGRPRDRLPPEANDCAGLVRYAYREAFRESATVPVAPPRKWTFPYTPLGARLFRVRSGEYRSDDVANGRFAEFADAETLVRYNTHRIGRDVEQARDGDLLFYRQPDQRMPFHVMIVLPRTAGEPTGAVVYHTGPIGKDPGEIRRRGMPELLAHPQPQWRPVGGNPNFLGVYRWNILKEDLP